MEFSIMEKVRDYCNSTHELNYFFYSFLKLEFVLYTDIANIISYNIHILQH